MTSTDLIQLRASAMPRAFLCPGSVRVPVVSIDERTEPATPGAKVVPKNAGDVFHWGETRGRIVRYDGEGFYIVAVGDRSCTDGIVVHEDDMALAEAKGGAT